jgi:hypothetical protein
MLKFSKTNPTMLVIITILSLIPVNIFSQTNEEKTITGYVENTQGKAWDGQIVELYEDDTLLGVDTLENGYFSVEHVITGVDETEEIPSGFTLYQNYPNPFNPTTIIKYELPSASRVSIRVYDIQGREITELVNKEQAPGNYSVIWDGTNRYGETVASGVYLYRLTAGGKSQARKMIYEKHGPGFEWGKPAGNVNGRTFPLHKTTGNGHWLRVSGTDVMTTEIDGLDFSGEGTVDLGTLVVPGKPVVWGFVYDLENKYDEEGNRNYPIPGLAGQKVFFKTDTNNYAITNENGLFKLIADTLKTDTIHVTNTNGDTTYYNWRQGITLQPDSQRITAFNDTTGIPLFKQWSDTLGIDFLEHLQYVSNIENRFPYSDWEQTMQRFTDDTIKIWLNRDNQPNDWYADSAWVAIKTCETGRIKYVETSDSASSHIEFEWHHIAIGQTAFISDYEGYYDEPGTGRGPRLHKNQFVIMIAGPPEQSALPPKGLKHVVAHEMLHTIYALGRHSPHIQDEFYTSPTMRANAGYPLGPNEREKKGMKLIYDLELNPKLLDYYK